MSELSKKQISYLRGLAHKLSVVVQVGKNGVSEAVVKDMDLKLSEHELIKVKLSCSDQTEFNGLVSQVVSSLNAKTVMSVGHTLVLFRSNPEETKIKLPE